MLFVVSIKCHQLFVTSCDLFDNMNISVYLQKLHGSTNSSFKMYLTMKTSFAQYRPFRAVLNIALKSPVWEPYLDLVKLGSYFFPSVCLAALDKICLI